VQVGDIICVNYFWTVNPRLTETYIFSKENVKAAFPFLCDNKRNTKNIIKQFRK